MKRFFGSIVHAAAAAFGVATTVVGVLGDPAVIGYLPHKVAVPVTIAGSIIAAISRSPFHPPEKRR